MACGVRIIRRMNDGASKLNGEFDDLDGDFDDTSDESPFYTPNVKSIRFVQYKLPHGRKEAKWIERDGETLTKARAIEAVGYEFEAEILRDYRTVSFEVINASDSDDVIASALVENGPGVPAAVDQMICAAFAELNRRKTGVQS